jgi:glyoxylase I family protein
VPLKLSTLLLFVPDLAEAKRFYGDVLGFPLVRETETLAVFRHEGADLAAFLCERSASPDDYSRSARSAFVFGVPSVDRAMRELSARGVTFLHKAPSEGPLGRYAAFVDPFGNVHEIGELQGQGV